ncbi:MAG: hypothetical protein ACREMZ_15690 [Gemmatimonadales bacterium]
MRLPYQARHPRPALSRKLRVARALNVSEALADKKLYGERSVNRECAKILASDLEAGDTEAAALFLSPIDAACAPRHSLSLHEALHRAELADAAEQVADENFREKLRQGTATVEEAREYLRKSALARAAAEEAERETQAWIDEQEARR